MSQDAQAPEYKEAGVGRERIGEDDGQGQLRHRIITPPGAVGEDAQAEPDPKSKIAVPKDERRYRLAAHRDSGAPTTR